jgi:vacuolar-type H+-ATPase subunit H
MPLFPALSGGGTVQTSNVDLKNFPPLQKVVDVTKLKFLDDPGLDALRAAFQIKDGRLFVQPFDVKLGGTTVRVSGSNGFDQSLRYDLGLRVPRSLMGGGANQAIAGLLSKAGAAGIDLNAAPEIPLGIKIGGTMTSPSVSVDVGSLASSVTQSAEKAVTQAVTQKVDSAAMRLIQDAEQRAAGIRKEAQTLADKVKQEGYQQADSLAGKSSNPLAQLAAKPAADLLRKQSDEKAASIIREASQRADSLVAQARRKAGQP